METKTANYGVDGPLFVFNTFLLGCFLIFVGIALFAWFIHSLFDEFLSVLAIVAGVSCFGIGLTILWGSFVGKLYLRDEILKFLDLRGDELVLGVGCGHGLFIIGAAKLLNKGGKAFGIDVWKEIDQAGNSPRATWRNAEIENVAARIALETADARALPFADESFDLIFSSWVLHNILRRKERRKALAETMRVLKPGGEIIIVDVWLGYEYANFFRRAGLSEVSVSHPYFLFFAPTFIVRAKKF